MFHLLSHTKLLASGAVKFSDGSYGSASAAEDVYQEHIRRTWLRSRVREGCRPLPTEATGGLWPAEDDITMMMLTKLMILSKPNWIRVWLALSFWEIYVLQWVGYNKFQWTHILVNNKHALRRQCIPDHCSAPGWFCSTTQFPLNLDLITILEELFNSNNANQLNLKGSLNTFN